MAIDFSLVREKLAVEPVVESFRWLIDAPYCSQGFCTGSQEGRRRSWWCSLHRCLGAYGVSSFPDSVGFSSMVLTLGRGFFSALSGCVLSFSTVEALAFLA